MLNDPPLPWLKPDRSWSGTGSRRQCQVTSAGVLRGTIRSHTPQDTTGPGPAGRLVWRITTYDGAWLDPITGDYVAAEKALLDATRELEN